LTIKALKNQVTSTNWGGYVAANSLSKPSKNSVTAVYGSWIVPLIMSSNQDGYSAYWVGIDGYSSSTVEQIGTSHNCINGVQQNYAWFEMYPGPSYGINGFPLAPGDVISASIEYKGNYIFSMTLYNNTQKTYTTIPTTYTTSKTALRQCVEWIVEAPYMNGILPLSDFVTAYMWGCIATINGVTGVINTHNWDCAPIVMVASNGTPKATVSPLLHDNGSFFMEWMSA
jgi:hypothetical protein